ncbi:MAG: efflux RND transporter periplasmic adaptor subunit [Myxococcales bacterium]|nr:efflux RND transporter periplasmic adaptor subunit [Myxococcales bacterium]
MDPPAEASASHLPLREVIEHEQSAHRRRVVLRIVLGVLAVAIVVALVIVLRPKPIPLADQFRTGVVARGDVIREVSATGRVEARTSVEVGAQISGRIAAVEVDFNDRVTRGQVLARFDTESLDAQVAQTKASVKAALAALEQARADRKRAQRQLERSQALFSRGIESKETIENLESAKTVADAAVKSASAQLDLQRANAKVAETNLRYAEVHSPIDGIVISRDVEAGQTVVASFQSPVLFVIAEDLAAMKVVAAIDEADMGEVKPAQAATFTVDAYPDQSFEAVVTELRSAAKVVQNVVTYEAVLEVDNPERLLRPGMTASVKVQTAAAPGVLHVPTAALRFTPPGREDEHKKHMVWVLRDDELVPLRVVPGISDGSVTQIDDDGTLASDDEVLVDLSPAGRKLHEGSRG